MNLFKNVETLTHPNPLEVAFTSIELHRSDVIIDTIVKNINCKVPLNFHNCSQLRSLYLFKENTSFSLVEQPNERIYKSYCFSLFPSKSFTDHWDVDIYFCPVYCVHDPTLSSRNLFEVDSRFWTFVEPLTFEKDVLKSTKQVCNKLHQHFCQIVYL